MELFLKVFLPIITALIGAAGGFLGGFFGGKAHWIKKTNNVNGNNNIVGDGNETVRGDRTTVTEDNSRNTTITASGEGSQAAGRDIINGSKK